MATTTPTNWLEATALCKDGWCEIGLVELAIFADGETEERMLKNLAHAITVHYMLAKQQGRTPFVDLLRDPSKPRPELQPNQPTHVRSLDLPEVVREALALVLHAPKSDSTVTLRAA